jgi:hypothetical protein
MRLFATAKSTILQMRATKTRTRPNNNNARGTIMKTLLCAIVALTVLSGAAASATAFDGKTFYQEQDRSHS